MTADPEHERAADLLGAFALDAVDPDERQLVDAHLPHCPRCRSEVDQLRRVAAGLALFTGLETAAPPPALWSRIESGIKKGGHDAETRPAGSAIVPLPERARGSSRRWRPGRVRAWIGGAAVGAVAAALAVLAVDLVHTQGQVHDLQSALAGRGAETAVRAALLSPGHAVVDLRSSAGAQLAEIVVQRDGTGYFVRSTMRRLPSSETYQLWASINGKAISLGLLGRKPSSGASFSLGTAVTGVRELMVTIEPPGGVPTPDRSPLATAPLSVS